MTTVPTKFENQNIATQISLSSKGNKQAGTIQQNKGSLLSRIPILAKPVGTHLGMQQGKIGVVNVQAIRDTVMQGNKELDLVLARLNAKSKSKGELNFVPDSALASNSDSIVDKGGGVKSKDRIPESALEVDRKISTVLDRMKASASTSKKDVKETVSQPKTMVKDIEVVEDQSGSIDIDLEEEEKEFNYYMTSQAKNMSRGSNPKEELG